MSPFLRCETLIQPLAQLLMNQLKIPLYQRDWPGPYKWTRVVRSSERASSMKKVEVSTDVARGVHNSHQRVIQSSKSPAGFITRPVFSDLPNASRRPTICPVASRFRPHYTCHNIDDLEPTRTRIHGNS